MNLAEALQESICEFENDATNILAGGADAAEYWLNELLIEDDGYRVAIHRTLDSICCAKEDSECYSVWALLKSFDRERQDVVEAARRIVARIQGRGDPESDQLNDLIRFKTHLARFGIKGRYLVRFLNEQIEPLNFPRDGEEFSLERLTIMTRVHDMVHKF